MAVPFSFLSRGYRESLHQKNYYSLLLLIGNSDIYFFSPAVNLVKISAIYFTGRNPFILHVSIIEYSIEAFFAPSSEPQNR